MFADNKTAWHWQWKAGDCSSIKTTENYIELLNHSCMTSREPYMLNVKRNKMLFQGWIIYVLIIFLPHLLQYLISIRALSKVLDWFCKLSEYHILSILQLPNKLNSHVRVLESGQLACKIMPNLWGKNPLLVYF